MKWLWLLLAPGYFFAGFSWAFVVHVAMRVVASTEGWSFPPQRAQKAFLLNVFVWPYSFTVILTTILVEYIIKIADKAAHGIAVKIRKKDSGAA